MLKIITGSDEGTIAEKAIAAYNSLATSDDDFANERIEGHVSDSESAFQACSQATQALQTPPFMGTKVVWLKGANFFASDRTSEAARTKEGVEMLLEELKRGLPDNIHFLLSCGPIDKRRAFYKWVKDNSEFQVYDKIDTSKDGWEEDVLLLVKRKSRPLNLEFTDEAMDLFIQMAGEDTRQIGSELTKLDLYLGPDRREVSLEDVRLMIPLSRKAVIFEIGRAIEARDAARAIQLIDDQLHSSESAVAIMRAAVIPTVRNLFTARSVLEGRNLPTSNYRSFAAALDKLPLSVRAGLPQKKAGGTNAYPLFNAANKARKFALGDLRSALTSCLKADESLVTSGSDHRMVLHRLVAELAVRK